MTGRRRSPGAGDTRRRLLRALAVPATNAVLPAAGAAATEADFPGQRTDFAPVGPGATLRFPRDHGAHRGYRIEWWYLTGWLMPAGASGTPSRAGEPSASRMPLEARGADGLRTAIGLQLTFFRIGTGYPAGNPSRFAPTDLLAGHAALMLPALKRPLTAQRLANAGGAGVRMREDDTDLAIGDWTLVRERDGGYATRLRDREFGWTLRVAPTDREPPWLQGEAGFSRKGPLPEQASHYYSRTQLRVSGRIDLDGPAARRAGAPAAREVDGVAWFDHEWSSALLADTATGWDWAGLNLHDGRSLVWFQVRSAAGGAPVHTHAALRDARGEVTELAQQAFVARRRWTSPVTNATYPIAPELRLRAAGGADWAIRLEPLMDDQEIDARASTGTVYWEGAVRVLEAASGREIGLGYLELTGYHRPVRL